MNNYKQQNNFGCLYVVATPIGNKNDITLRALKVLKQVDLIAAEDTRTTGRFLSAHDIHKDLISYHDHNEDQRTPVLIDRLVKGKSIALVSTAGTPSVSDPGYRLIKEAVASQIQVIPIPGASAPIAALSVSGLPTDSFVFVGFPARKKGKRLKQLKILANDTRTIVFYESPRRIMNLMEELVSILGDRYCVLAREMTKIHEEFIRGKLTHIIKSLKKRPPIKGELTLLVTGQEENKISMEHVHSEIEKKLKIGKNGLSDISKQLAEKYGISRSKVYETALRIKERQSLDKT